MKLFARIHIARTCVVVVLALLTGCAQQRILGYSRDLMLAGQYEQAVENIDLGRREYPESNALRAAALQTRNDALGRLIKEASAARSLGRLDEAQSILERAAQFDTSGQRVTTLLNELTVERRQREALAEAEQLIQAKRSKEALSLIAAALKDNPRHSDLLSLQRRIESEARHLQLRTPRTALAETRPVSLDFRDANLRTVLDVVTRNSGINFILDKDIRPDTRVTVYLRSTLVEDAIDLLATTHGLAKKVIDSKTVLIYPNTPEKQREHQELVIRVFHLASAEAKGAAAFLKSMLRIREPFVDDRANMLALRESPENIELAERLVALYDTQEPEVLLELEVIEIRSSRLTELGIKFPDNFSLTMLPPSGSSGLTVSSIQDVNSNRIGVGIGSVLVNLKREVGDFNTLANPRVRAKNREKAKVLIGDKVPVVTATTGQGGFVSDSVSYLDVGLKLDVEPTVYADDEVAIKVGLEVSSIAREVQTTSGTLAYQIGTRNASTLLRLRDGETQLLAGLISREDRSSASRVPGLGDLPVAGRLFSSQRDDNQRTELVLAITPRIVRNIRLPSASEAELWIGTDALTRMRPVVDAVLPSSSAAAKGSTDKRPAETSQPELIQAPAKDSVSLKWRADGQVKVGEIFPVTIALVSSVPLKTVPVEIGFDKDHLTLVDVEEGDYFKRGGAEASFTQSIDTEEGRANIGVASAGNLVPPGEGTIMTLRFRALAAGPTEMIVHGFKPVGDEVQTPSALPQPLRIEVK